MNHISFFQLGFRSLVVFVGLSAACAGVKPKSMTGNGGSTGSGFGGNTPPPPPCPGNVCTDFPPDPKFDNGVDPSVAGNFGGSPPVSASGVCITEPEDGTLFPNNWLRPRVKFANPGGKVAQITMSADNQANTLTAYTNLDNYKIPPEVWAGLRGHQTQNQVTVTVWLQGGGASQTHFTTAPVSAGGNLVFWAANPQLVGAQPPDCYTNLALCSNAAQLRGFSVGDESTIPVLSINQVMQQSRRQDSGNLAPVICIGCHTATPDDSFVSLIDHYSWRAAVASVNASNTGALFTTLTAGGLEALQQPGWGPFTYPAVDPGTKQGPYWAPGLRIGVASLGEVNPLMADWSNTADSNDSPHLAWINLEAPNQHVKQNSDPANWAFVSFAQGAGINSGNALGYIAHNGDAGGAATPNWSHDGTTIAYASTNASISGRLNLELPNINDTATDPLIRGTKQNPNPNRSPGLTNIFTVPFNGGLGGQASPVPGAATSQFEEYYPAYSPDDKLIAFTRVPAGQVMYANPNAEIAVVDSAGDPSATVLRANTPPSCSGKMSPGVNNHWPKWSPDYQISSQGTYYWLIFSSNRTDLPQVRAMDGHFITISQLYMAPVVVNETGITSYPAIYLWNQPTDQVNTTPAWSTFQIPPVQ